MHLVTIESPNSPMCKVFTRGEKTSPPFPYLWKYGRVEFTDFTSFVEALEGVQSQDTKAITHITIPLDMVGELAPRSKKLTPDNTASWIALDIDNDIEGVENTPRAVLTALEAPWNEAACWWQRTSSWTPEKIKYRFFFMLPTPTSSVFFRKIHNAGLIPLSDFAQFSHGQPHFMAPPNFIECEDPCKEAKVKRSGTLMGCEYLNLANLQAEFQKREKAKARAAALERVKMRPRYNIPAQLSEFPRDINKLKERIMFKLIHAPQGKRHDAMIWAFSFVAKSAVNIEVEYKPVLEEMFNEYVNFRPDDLDEIKEAVMFATQCAEDLENDHT